MRVLYRAQSERLIMMLNASMAVQLVGLMMNSCFMSWVIRGINQAIAQQLLLKAFFADLFVDDELNEKIHLLIE